MGSTALVLVYFFAFLVVFIERVHTTKIQEASTEQNKIACEYQTLNLDCQSGSVLTINSAIYGRSDSTTCPHHSVETDQCAASASLSIVKQSCEGKQTCTVQSSNSVFGDPCPYIYKYLNVTYSCAKVPAMKTDCKTTRKGKSYDGKISKTEKGFDCQAWTVKIPHKHKYTEKLGDQSNYCRNPDNSRRPWCYTSSKSKRWDYCVIPICEREVKECIPDAKGEEYNGFQSTTISGRKCQSWSSSKPHKNHYFKLESIEREVNYCRNFDDSKQPWCYTTDRKKRWEYCDIPPCEVKECLSGSDRKGRYYHGKIKTTKNGYTCQPWSSDEPHKHNYNGIAGDHCRNPDGSKHPWCYTTDPKKRWDYCDIPVC